MAGKTERSRICLAGKDPDDRCVRVISTGSTADVIGNSDLGGSSSGYVFCFLNLSVEYEYLFADGGFSVDSILGKARRKKTFDCDKEDVQVIAPANSYVLKDYEKQGMKVIDCTSHNAGADVYALISQKGAQTTKVLFEPGDKMKAAMRRVFPRKFI